MPIPKDEYDLFANKTGKMGVPTTRSTALSKKSTSSRAMAISDAYGAKSGRSGTKGRWTSPPSDEA